MSSMIRALRRGARCLSLACMVMFIATACTTLRPVASSPEQVGDRIDVLQTGDRVRLMTLDGMRHDLRVQYLDSSSGVLVGGEESVPVAEIAAVERRERSWIKTGVLIGLLVAATFGSGCEDDPSCDLGYGGLCC